MLLILSIVLEAAVAVIAILAAREKPYMYGLALTFAAYVLYDIARFLQWSVEGPLLSGLFLVASATALISVWGIYKNRSK
jgi:hypothetical protein